MTTSPPVLSTTRTIKSFNPLQLGKMLAVMYGAMGLIFCPFFLLFSLFAPHSQGAHVPAVFLLGTGFALMLPVIYACMGFIGGVVSGFIYNLIAKWIGGIEVEVE
jgi:hypothetical protein